MLLSFSHISLTLPLEDPILKFLLILVIILAAPLLLNKLKIPYLLGLIIAGAFNGLILPVTLGVMLIASRNKRIVGEEYKHPMPLIILGAIVVCISLYSGVQAVPGILDLFG